MTRAVPPRALALIKDFEKCVLTSYDDGVGIVTAGWGHVVPGGKLGTAYTRRQAELWLSEDLRIAAKRVEGKIGNVVSELTDNQYGALISFVFNLGTGPAKPEWKIWGLLRAQAFDQIPGQMARFVYAGGKKLNGLVRRRNAEIELWSEGEPGSESEAPSSAVTRHTETPPAPAEKAKNGPLVTAVVTACTTCGVAAKSVTDAISPFAPHSDVVGNAVMVLATLGAGAAGLMVVLNLMHRNAAKQ